MTAEELAAGGKSALVANAHKVSIKKYYNMKRYYLDRKMKSKSHELHQEGCSLLPLKDGIDLGLNLNYRSALREAYQLYEDISGCVRCTQEHQ